MIPGGQHQQLHKGTHVITGSSSHYWNNGWGTASTIGSPASMTEITMHPSKRGIVGTNSGKATFRYWTNGAFGALSQPGSTLQGAMATDSNPSGTYMAIAAAPTTATIRLRASNIDITAADGSSSTTTYTPSSYGSVAFEECSFGPAETDIVTDAGEGPIFMQAWAWSNSTQFGTKRTNASTANSNTAAIHSSGARFSPFGNSVFLGAYGSNGTPWLYAYAYTEGTGFGTKFANVSATGLETHLGFNVTGASATSQKILFGAYSVAPIIVNFSSSGGFGSKVTSPQGMPIHDIGDNFTKSLQLGNNETTCIYPSGSTRNGLVVYTYSNSTGFGTKFADPSPLVSVNHATWSR